MNFAELWLELAREGYEPLKKYINSTVLPNVLVHYGFVNGAIEQVRRMISWRFFDRIPQTSSYLLNAIQRLISETKYETPFLETIERLTSNQPINISTIASNDTVAMESAIHRRAEKTFYVYSFQHKKTIDIRGATNYFGGAGHTSDLLFLMGPSLFQQISRRKMSSMEMRLCRRFRHLFSEFIKMGNPTPGRVFDAWRPYTAKQKFVQILGDFSSTSVDTGDTMTMNFAENGIFIGDLEKNSVDIENMIHGQAHIISTNILNPYHIGKENQPQNPTDSARMSKSYLGIYETSEYYNALTKINSFWMDLLPEMSSYHDHRLQNYTNDVFSRSNYDDDPLYIAMAAANGSKFKHAFFSMLILVCLLLAVLCICLYILKKNQRNIDTSFL